MIVSTIRSYAKTQNLLEQALALFRETGDRWGEADALQGLGAIAANEGKHAGAWSFYQHALTLSRQIGHHRCEALLLRSLGHLFADQLRTQEARKYYGNRSPVIPAFAGMTGERLRIMKRHCR